MPAPQKPSVSITVRIRDGIAQITLDRPPLNVLDALTSATRAQRAPAWSHR